MSKELKVVVLGDGSVGKSELIRALVNKEFLEKYNPTIGIDFENYDMKVKGEDCSMKIWDTAGQKRFQNLGTNFWRGADVAILAYAVNDKVSFVNIEKWRDELYKSCVSRPPIILVALKTDLNDKVVTKEEGKKLAQKLSATYYECSAKNGLGILKVFSKILCTKFPEIYKGKLQTLEKEEKEKEGLKEENEDSKRRIAMLEKENKDLKEENEGLKGKIKLLEVSLSLLNNPENLKTVVNVQSFFRRFIAQKEYLQKKGDIKIEDIKKEAQQIINHFMNLGNFKGVELLFKAVADEKWIQAYNIIKKLNNKELTQTVEQTQSEAKPSNESNVVEVEQDKMKENDSSERLGFGSIVHYPKT